MGLRCKGDVNNSDSLFYKMVVFISENVHCYLCYSIIANKIKGSILGWSIHTKKQLK